MAASAATVLVRAAAGTAAAAVLLRAGWRCWQPYREKFLGPLCAACSSGDLAGTSRVGQPGSAGLAGRYCARCIRACLTADHEQHSCRVCAPGGPRP